MRFKVYNTRVNKIIEADSSQAALSMFALTNPEYASDTVLIKQLPDMDDGEEEKTS